MPVSTTATDKSAWRSRMRKNASRLQLKQAARFYNDLLAGKPLTDMVPSHHHHYKRYLRSDNHARIYWCDLRHHNQHKDCSRACQKRNIAITLQLITARSVTSVFTPSCEQLVLYLACVFRLWCGRRWCFSWPWRNHLEDHDQEKNRPWPRNNIHALFEMVEIEYQELFQQLCSIAKGYKFSTTKFAVGGVVTMNISQKTCFINVFPADHSMHKFYRNSLSRQPVISVEYWQIYEENTVVK